MRVSQRLLRLVVILVLGGFTLGVCLVALGPGIGKIAASAKYTDTVAPDLRPLEGPTSLYDADGNVMDRLGDLDRTPVDLSEVSQPLVDAVVATEDHTFFQNPGVDIRSSLRAFLSNVDSGGIGQGGSTITQQLIKNRYFTNPKRDLDRKVREAILAARLTGEWSKRRILQEYLNTVYFGANAYGVQAAANRIIGAPLATLDLGDAALLAGLIKDPINFDPFAHPDAARKRRDVVLRAMERQNKITAAEAAFARAKTLPTRPDCNVAPNDPKCSLLQPHSLYAEEVKNRLLELKELGPDEKTAAQRVFAGGLRVYTAYRPDIQAEAQGAVDSTVASRRRIRRAWR
jgi:penicillin-binding protein 1A